MSLHALANHMSSRGRGEDSMLVHMTPGEVHGLQALAMKHGGSLTINPDTGLPEAGFLKSILPILAGLALGPAGMGIAFGGLSSAASAGLLVGGVTGLATGSLSKGLMAGLGAYGGAGLGGSLASAGEGALSSQITGEIAKDKAAEIAAGQLGEEEIGKMVTQRLTDTPAISKLGAGLGAITDSGSAAMNFAKQNMMPLGAAAAPIMADMMVPTTTKMAPVQNPGRIREKRWDGRQFVDVASTDANVYNTSGRSFSDLYRGYNGGGIVALADGGLSAGMQYAAANKVDVGANINKWIQDNPNASKDDINTAMTKAGLTQADVNPFLTANTNISDAQRYALSHTDEINGLAGLNANIMGALKTNPTMTQAQIDAEQAKYGVTDANIQAPLSDGFQVAATDTAKAQNYLNTNPDVMAWINSAEGKAYVNAHPEFDANDIAYTHFKRYGEGEGRKWEAPAAVTTVVGGTGIDALTNPPTYVDHSGYHWNGSEWVPNISATQNTTTDVATPTDLYTAPETSLPVGVSGNTGPSQIGGGATVNPNGTITTSPRIPDIPVGGFTGAKNLRDAYTKGGGSLGYTSAVPASLEDFNKKYVTDRMSGDSLAAYEYLTGKKGAAYPVKSGVGQISRPYDEAVLGYPARGNLPYIYNKATGKMDPNPDYVAPGRDAAGNVTYSMSLNDIKSSLKDAPLSGQALYDWAIANNLSAQQIADATGRTLSSVYADFRAGSKSKTAADKKKADDAAAAANNQMDSSSTGGGEAAGGLQQAYAMGGATGYALGGLGTLGGYSDGGRLLKGPGDGVSDSIPATIGAKGQPARLADGEFVVPARIVSELGNGSTDAGAKKLYAMMDRVQRARGKTTGKNKVAANSRADQHLPA